MSKTGITIEKAGLSQLEILIDTRMEVLRAVFGLSPDEDMSQLRKNNLRYYKESLASGAHTSLLAYVEGELAGCGGICYYNEMPTPDNPNGRCGFLMNIYTKPLFRRRGVARAVVGYLIEEAKERHISKIYLESSKMGLPFYESCGFAPLEDYLRFRQE